MTDLLKIWVPISKSSSGSYEAILTDTSIDRDDELMGESVMDKLSRKLALPALADHNNTMDSWIGGFKNLQKVHNNGHYAVTGEPTFFSKEANPKAQQVRKQIDEASDMGIPCGVSIGARPITSEMITKDGKQYKKWTDIEVMEGTFTPVQSNRNSYAYVAKSFGLKDKNLEGENMTKEDIKKAEGEPEPPKDEKVEDEPKPDAKPDEKAPEAKTEGETKPEEKTEKTPEIDVQKLIEEGIQKAMNKIPKLKAIQEPMEQEDAGKEPEKMGFIEGHLAKRYGYKEGQ